jgi:hypothetical protein
VKSGNAIFVHELSTLIPARGEQASGTLQADGGYLKCFFDFYFERGLRSEVLIPSGIPCGNRAYFFNTSHSFDGKSK